MKTQPPSRGIAAFDSVTRNEPGYHRARGLFTFFAPLLVIAASIIMSSCAGYTSPGGQSQTPGTGVLSASATSLAFGSVAVGSNATQSLSLTNTGTATVNIGAATISGTGFPVVGGNPPSLPPVGQRTTVQVQFGPTTSGAASATLIVTSDASNSPLAISLTGTGTQTGMTISPSSISFGNVTVGQSSSQTVILTNTGSANLVVSGATVSGAGFGITGLSLPVTIAAGQNTSFSVQFAPTVAGTVSGSIAFTDNASGSQQSLTLVGTGVTAGATLTATPGSVNFGNVVVGASSNQTITFPKTGGP